MFFLNIFPVCFSLFVLLFLVTPCLVVAVQLCMEWIPIKKKKQQQQVFDADWRATQQINFTGNLRGVNNRVTFFIIEEAK